jgi:hypothetical protein
VAALGAKPFALPTSTLLIVVRVVLSSLLVLAEQVGDLLSHSFLAILPASRPPARALILAPARRARAGVHVHLLHAGDGGRARGGGGAAAPAAVRRCGRGAHLVARAAAAARHQAGGAP